MQKKLRTERKSKVAYVRLTPDEQRAFLDFVSTKDTTVSEWLRDLGKKAIQRA